MAVQLLVLRVVQRLRRSRALALTGGIWAIAWAMLGIGGLPIPQPARIACVWGYAAVFGLGETFMAPTTGPLVNSLAHERVRGRANSLSAFSYSLALIASPAVVTGMLAAGAGALWIALLCAGCFATVATAFALGRTLTTEQDTVSPHRGAQSRPPEPDPRSTEDGRTCSAEPNAEAA